MPEGKLTPQAPLFCKERGREDAPAGVAISFFIVGVGVRDVDHGISVLLPAASVTGGVSVSMCRRR